MIKTIKKAKAVKQGFLRQVRILGIGASARRNANTETLLDSALRGARDKGAKTEKVILNLLKIKPCQACARCSRTSACCMDDDMAGLLKKLEACDALIIASPVYFGTVTAQLKTMMDRCQPAWAQKYVFKRRSLRKRRGMFISVSNYNNKDFFRNSKEIINILFTVLGIKLSSELYAPYMENKADAKNNPLLRKKTFEYGQALAKSTSLDLRAKK